MTLIINKIFLPLLTINTLFIAFANANNPSVAGDHEHGNDDNLVLASVTNRLPEAGASLPVNCISSDAVDLGVVVVPNGKAMEWRFRPDNPKTARFHCTVTCPYGSREFYAYNVTRDRPSRCSTVCAWNVDQHGISGINQGTGAVDIKIKW